MRSHPKIKDKSMYVMCLIAIASVVSGRLYEGCRRIRCKEAHSTEYDIVGDVKGRIIKYGMVFMSQRQYPIRLPWESSEHIANRIMEALDYITYKIMSMPQLSSRSYG